MNKECCGAPHGYCTRHGMPKGETLVSLCNGTNSANCSALYWNAWERGRAGATITQESPLFDPPGYCDGQPGGVPCEGCGSQLHKPGLVARAVSAAAAYARYLGDGAQQATDSEQVLRRNSCDSCPLNDVGTCVGCGCFLSLKTTMRLETCPAGKWFPELHPVRSLAGRPRNLLYSIFPVKKNREVWQWNLHQLALRWPLFDGITSLAIHHAGGGGLATDSADDVITFCREIGLHWNNIEAFANDARLREVVSFPWLLRTVEGSRHSVTFAAHAKGVTHSMQSITIPWAERQYRVCLDDPVAVTHALERYSMAGAFRRFGEFTTPGNHCWHYSGTFYWFRNDDVFEKTGWDVIDRQFFGTESWPGRMFRPEQTACLFGDDIGDLYDASTWSALERQVQIWEQARS